MRHFLKFMMLSSIAVFTGCQDERFDLPSEKLSSNKVHARVYVSLNYDDVTFKGNNNLSNRRFIVEARDADNTETVLERKEIVYTTNSTLTEGFERLPVAFELDQKKYVVSVWMDYIEKGTDTDFYYNTENLNNITMIVPQSESNVHRDALACTQTIDLTEQALGVEYAVNSELRGVVAKVDLTTQDWLNFMQDQGEAAKTAQINIKYESEMPVAYNAVTGESSLAIVEETTVPINVPKEPGTTGKTSLSTSYFMGSSDATDVSVNVLSASGSSLFSNKYTIAFSSGNNNKIEESFLTGTENPIKEIIFDGSGTEENPFKIKTVENLYKLMELINTDKDTDYQSAHYQQTADFDLAGQKALGIGTEEFPFKGVYDGNGKKISKNKGLFGVIDGATIKNVRIIDNFANADTQIKTTGFICNSSKGVSLIENSGCELAATVEDKSAIFGTICGEVTNGTLSIKGCRVRGKVNEGSVFKVINQTTTIYMGGFIGKINSGATANITDSYFTNSKNTFASGKQTDNCVGGLCGVNEGNLNITRCYVIAKIQSGGTTANGGIITGKGSSTIIENCYIDNKDKFYSGKNTQWVQNEEDNKVIIFASEAWPNWSTDGSTTWGNIGGITINPDETTTTTYPTLKWEHEENQ